MSQPLLHVCHAPEDHGWVHGFLLPALNVAPAQVRTRDNDRLGASLLDEIGRAVKLCPFTLLVASTTARSHSLAEFAASLAQLSSLVDGDGPRLIVFARDAAQDSPEAQKILSLGQRSLVGLYAHDQASTSEAIDRLRRTIGVDGPTEDEAIECPYLGLDSFRADQRDLLFGREKDCSAMIDRLVTHNRVLALGPSGCGKSSLVHAAVLPALHKKSELRRATIHPVERSGDPGTALRAAVAAFDLEGLEPALDVYMATTLNAPVAEVKAGRKKLSASLPSRPPPRVLVIDPLEGVFAQPPEARTRWFHELAALWNLPWCYVIACMRADFFGALMVERCWEDLRRNVYPVAPLDEQGLREAIVEPARRNQVYFEPSLVERLIREIDRDRSSAPLPLLQVALKQLWDRRELRYISTTSYDTIIDKDSRGLTAVITLHADRVMQGFNTETQRIAERILLDLVQLGEGRPHTRRQRTVGELRRSGDDNALFDDILRELIDGRLVAVGDGGCVDLAHDVLITGWSELAALVTRRHNDLIQRDRFEARAQAWSKDPKLDLLGARDAAAARRWQGGEAAAALGFSPTFIKYLEASEVALRESADREQAAADELRRQLQLSLIEQGRRLVVTGRGARALPYLVEAMQHGADGVAFRQLLREAARMLPLVVCRGHTDAVNDACFVNGDTLIATAGADGVARLWSAATGAPVSAPLRHTGEINSICGNADSTQIATAGADGTAVTWDRLSGAKLVTIRHAAEVFHVEFGPGDRLVTASEDGSARVWNARSGAPMSAAIQHAGWVWTATLLDEQLITASDDETARVSLLDGTIVAVHPHDGGVMVARPSPDGRYIATASADGTARILPLGDASMSVVLSHARTSARVRREDLRVWMVDVSPDGPAVATACADGTVRVWHAETGELIAGPMRHKSRIWCVRFDRRGRRVATASDDGTARVWDAETGAPVAGPFEHDAAVQIATFSADGTTVLTASDDHSARLWRADDDGDPVCRLVDGNASLAVLDPCARWALAYTEGFAIAHWDGGRRDHLALSIDPEDALVAIDLNGAATLLGYESGRIEVWQDGAVIHELAYGGDELQAVRFAPDRSMILAGGDAGAALWRMVDGRFEPARYVDAGTTVYGIAFGADAAVFATASGDRQARIWRTATCEPATEPMMHRDVVRSVTFSPDGALLLTASEDCAARVWDARTGKELTPPLEHDATVTDARFSADGTRVVTVSDDCTVRVWDARTGGALMAPRDMRCPGLAAAFTSDGEAVITVGVDAVLRRWCVAVAPGSADDWRALNDRCGLYLLRDGLVIENHGSWTDPVACASLRRSLVR